jgi:hypothetical protein
MYTPSGSVRAVDYVHFSIWLQDFVNVSYYLENLDPAVFKSLASTSNRLPESNEGFIPVTDHVDMVAFKEENHIPSLRDCLKVTAGLPVKRGNSCYYSHSLI